MPFKNSIREVPEGAPASRPHTVRDSLKTDELARTMAFSVSLRMRDFQGLEARIQAGQKVPRAEMEAKYLPLKADYARVGAWLVGQGFELTTKDSNHTNLFARGTVAQVAAAFKVAFARVATADGEFSSAVTTPSLPGDIAPVVLGMSGLQPHIRMHVPKPQANSVNNSYGLVAPSNLLADYNVPGTLDGTGETIAIIMSATPLTTDLSSFWSQTGITRPNTATYTVIPISGGPGPQGSQNSDSVGEVTLDTEWSTGMAPGASLRLYALPDLGFNYLLEACTQVVTDGMASVASFSAGANEYELGDTESDFDVYSQEFAQMAAAGITMLVSSGDGGSNPDTGDNGYTSTNQLSAEYPASDPHLTSVGGTSPIFDVNWNPAEIPQERWPIINGRYRRYKIRFLRTTG